MATRQVKQFRFLIVVWCLWASWTVIRLLIDYPRYGQDSLRDALPVIDFLALFLGGGLSYAYRSRPGLNRSFQAVLAILSIYSLAYLVRTTFPTAISQVTDFSNIGVAGTALTAAGLWRIHDRLRWVYLATGAMAVIVSQGRMIYLAVTILLVVHLFRIDSSTLMNHQSEARVIAPRGRVVGVLVLAGLGLSILSILPSLTFVQGRLGALTLGDMKQQVAMVLDADEASAGSAGDRKRWWREISHDLAREPGAKLLGLGLGRDLLNGFRAPDGSLVRKPHNDLIEWFAREGPLGLISLMLFLRASVQAALHGLRRHGIGIVGSAWILAATLTCLAQPYLSYAHGVVPLMLATGMILYEPQSYAYPSATEFTEIQVTLNG